MRRFTVLMPLIVLVLFVAGSAAADVPLVINHQGMLTDAAGTPLIGSFDMTFRLYDVAAGGTELWSETQLVTVDQGIFNVYLGSVTALDPALFTGQELYLGVAVASDPEMAPRLRLGSVAYALAADHTAGQATVWYLDADGDGYGAPGTALTAIGQPSGYVANDQDCDDTDQLINPAAAEVCDGIDNNCNGQIDEGTPCDDGDGCTIDVCNGAGGCSHVPINCDDGIDCTIDTCDNGVCSHTLAPGVCLIGGVCYQEGQANPLAECEECQSALDAYGWTLAPDGTACAGGVCSGGVCTPAKAHY